MLLHIVDCIFVPFVIILLLLSYGIMLNADCKTSIQAVAKTETYCYLKPRVENLFCCSVYETEQQNSVSDHLYKIKVFYFISSVWVSTVLVLGPLPSVLCFCH